jgi:hypothetical protein
MQPPTPPPVAEEHICRPCRKTYTRKELDGRRSCPKCRGPLFSTNQIASYRANTEAALRKHKNHAVFASLGASALVAILESTTLLQHEVSEARTFAIGSIIACATSSVPVIMWWRTGGKALMAVGLTISQIAALLAFYLADATLTPAYAVMGLLPLARTARIAVMASLIATFYAWQQFASHCKVASHKGL